jgi:hypothetical protein
MSEIDAGTSVYAPGSTLRLPDTALEVYPGMVYV